jgi:hypothetical protein
MARLMILFGPLLLGFTVYCVVTVLMTRDDQVRFLPKTGWLVLVLLFPLVGGIAWVLVGRDRQQSRRSADERPAPQFPEYDRPGRASGATAESDEEFLRRIRERAEEQRREAQEKGQEPGLSAE